jgi:hypothetical protein
VPAPERRAFLSREGPISIRVFFKLGITYAVVVMRWLLCSGCYAVVVMQWLLCGGYRFDAAIVDLDLGQQKGRPTGPPSSGVRMRACTAIA